MIGQAILTLALALEGASPVPIHCDITDERVQIGQMLDRPISADSYRIASWSDSLAEFPSATVVTSDSGMRLPAPGLRHPENAPALLTIVLVSRHRTCTARMTPAQCPAVKKADNLVKATSIPIGHNTGVRRGGSIDHPSHLVLKFRDGDGNTGTWSREWDGNPAGDSISKALEVLRPCMDGLVREFPPHKP